MTEVITSALVAANEINIMLDTLGDASRLSMGALEPEPEPAKLDAIARLGGPNYTRVTKESIFGMPRPVLPPA